MAGHFRQDFASICLGRTIDTARCRVVHPEAYRTRLVRLPVGIPTAGLASAAAVALERAEGPPGAVTVMAAN
jgi:hypothetical protein